MFEDDVQLFYWILMDSDGRKENVTFPWDVAEGNRV